MDVMAEYRESKRELVPCALSEPALDMTSTFSSCLLNRTELRTKTVF